MAILEKRAFEARDRGRRRRPGEQGPQITLEDFDEAPSQGR